MLLLDGECETKESARELCLKNSLVISFHLKPFISGIQIH